MRTRAVLCAGLLLALAPASLGSERTITVRATAYCERGKTATGTRAGPGSIAVDPRVIPLGSKLHVEGYGHGTAVDTGRLIKGRRIDVWISSRGACCRWGVRRVRVRVLKEGKRR